MERLNISVQTGRPYSRNGSEYIRSVQETNAARSLYGQHWDDIGFTTKLTHAANADIRRHQKKLAETPEYMHKLANVVRASTRDRTNALPPSLRRSQSNQPNFNTTIQQAAVSMQQSRLTRPTANPPTECYYFQSKKY